MKVLQLSAQMVNILFLLDVKQVRKETTNMEMIEKGMEVVIYFTAKIMGQTGQNQSILDQKLIQNIGKLNHLSLQMVRLFIL